jgi:hypothetical protein
VSTAAAAAVALDMRPAGRPSNGLLDRLAAKNSSGGAARTILERALAVPGRLSGVTGQTVAAFQERVPVLAEVHLDAAACPPGLVP